MISDRLLCSMSRLGAVLCSSAYTGSPELSQVFPLHLYKSLMIDSLVISSYKPVIGVAQYTVGPIQQLQDKSFSLNVFHTVVQWTQGQ